MTLVRQWRHIQMSKRAGRGHDPTGIAGTPRGGLAVMCRACPQPGINLPPNWEKEPEHLSYVVSFASNVPSPLNLSFRWRYTLFLAQDANFRLKSRFHKDSKDPTLGPGLAYFVNNEEYLEYLAKHIDQDEASNFSPPVTSSITYLQLTSLG